MTNALIIGAGVSGITSAIRLAEAGYQVAVWGAALPPSTTSNIAAAIWYPYKAYPIERVEAWGRVAYAELTALAADPAAGIIVRTGVDCSTRPMPDPWWRAGVASFRRAEAADLPPGFSDGFVIDAPVVTMDRYLPYLLGRLRDLGGTIERRPVDRLELALDACDLVINCAGLGARELVPDPQLLPIRGQIVRVAQVGLERFILDNSDDDATTYIIPRIDDTILGGTAQVGNEMLAIDGQTAADILARCIAIEPRLARAEVLEHRVGLRPGRPAIRLESEPFDAGTVIHNYGHGGAGVTLSWGCADDVVRLAASAAQPVTAETAPPTKESS